MNAPETRSFVPPHPGVGNPGMLVGCARVSTEDQLLSLQIDALLRAGVDRGYIYEEQVSGVSTKRPQLDNAIKALRPGDVLVCWRLDRLGRSVPELIRIMDDLQKRGIGFRSLSESIDTTTAAGKMVFHMLAAFAEFERNLISERTKAGMKAARARGHRGGRKTKMPPAKVKAAIAMLGDPRVTMDEVAKALNVSRSTIQRALVRHREAEKLKQLRENGGRKKDADRAITHPQP
jgi:DNA invertase Pin-like site-specific DNA recombinase